MNQSIQVFILTFIEILLLEVYRILNIKKKNERKRFVTETNKKIKKLIFFLLNFLHDILKYNEVLSEICIFYYKWQIPVLPIKYHQQVVIYKIACT